MASESSSKLLISSSSIISRDFGDPGRLIGWSDAGERVGGEGGEEGDGE